MQSLICKHLKFSERCLVTLDRALGPWVHLFILEPYIVCTVFFGESGFCCWFFSSADCIWKALIWGLKYMGDIFSKHKGFLDYLTKQNKTKKLFYNIEVYFASKIMDSSS